MLLQVSIFVVTALGLFAPAFLYSGILRKNTKVIATPFLIGLVLILLTLTLDTINRHQQRVPVEVEFAHQSRVLMLSPSEAKCLKEQPEVQYPDQAGTITQQVEVHYQLSELQKALSLLPFPCDPTPPQLKEHP